MVNKPDPVKLLTLKSASRVEAEYVPDPREAPVSLSAMPANVSEVVLFKAITLLVEALEKYRVCEELKDVELPSVNAPPPLTVTLVPEPSVAVPVVVSVPRC
jgi:hypothetical protein